MFNQDILLKFIQGQVQKNQPEAPQMKEGGDAFSEKVRTLMHEGYPQKQAVAIAYSYQERGKLEHGGSMTFSSHQREGLPGGPNEIDTYTQGVITTSRGQWDYPGQITRIPSNRITMEGVPYPVLGVSDTGHSQLMSPGGEYMFDGNSVTEYPMVAQGGEMIKRADGSYSRRGLWDNIRANRGSGKKPTKEMLKQEKKIRAQEKAYGGFLNEHPNVHPMLQEAGEMPFGMPLKSANPYLLPEYRQPMVGRTILPDPQRPELMNTGATEYKIGIGFDDGNVTIPTVVSGQYMNPRDAVQRYMITGEHFKEMPNPRSYSQYYDYMNQLGLMQPKKREGGWLNKYKKAGRVREDMESIPMRGIESMPVETTDAPAQLKPVQQPIITSRPEPSFAGAFDRARMMGDEEFTWKGKTYGTNLASERKESEQAVETSGTVNTPKVLPNKQQPPKTLPTAEIVAQRGAPNWNMDAVTRSAFGQRQEPQYINNPPSNYPNSTTQIPTYTPPTLEYPGNVTAQRDNTTTVRQNIKTPTKTAPVIQKSIDEITNEGFGVKSPGKSYFGNVENTETGPVGITTESSQKLGVTGPGGFVGASYHNPETEKLSTGPSSFIPVSAIITPVAKTQTVVDNTGKELVKTLKGQYIYSDDDLKAKSVIQNRAQQCSIDSKGNCLAGTNMWMNRYVAPGLDVLNTDQINDKYNIQSGNENSGYGPTADSWDIQGLLQKNGATQLYAAKNVSDWRKLSDQKKKEIYSKMTVGTLIGAGGESGLPDRDEWRGANKKQGLIANRHSYRVVGFSDDKDHTPIVAEFGHGEGVVRKITDTPLFTGDKENPDKFNITNITIPKEYGHLTYDYVKGKDKTNSKANYYDKDDKLVINKANIRSSDNSLRGKLKGEETPFDPKEQLFIDGVNDNIKTIMQVTGASQQDVLNAGKLAFGIFQNETRGGRSTQTASNQLIKSASESVFDLLPESVRSEVQKTPYVGKLATSASRGVTRMKYADLVGKDKKSKLAKMFSDFGITEDDFDLTDENVPKQALATVLSILSHSGDIKGVNKWAVLAKQHQKPYLGKKDIEYLKKGESDYANNVLKNATRVFSKSTGQGISEAIDELSKRKEVNEYNKSFMPTGITGPAGFTGNIAQKKNGGTWLDNY